MLTQTCALITILLGVRAPWNAQVRRRDGLDFRDILPAYIGHLTLGGLLLGLVFIDIRLALMLSPHQYRTSCGTVARELDGRRQTGRDNAAQRDLWGAFGRY